MAYSDPAACHQRSGIRNAQEPTSQTLPLQTKFLGTVYGKMFVCLRLWCGRGTGLISEWTCGFMWHFTAQTSCPYLFILDFPNQDHCNWASQTLFDKWVTTVIIWLIQQPNCQLDTWFLLYIGTLMSENSMELTEGTAAVYAYMCVNSWCYLELTGCDRCCWHSVGVEHLGHSPSTLAWVQNISLWITWPFL